MRRAPYRPHYGGMYRRDPDSGFWAFVRRHRVGLAPVICGFAVLVISTIFKFSGIAGWVVWTVYFAAAGGVVLANHRINLEDGVAKVHRRQEMWYVGILVAATLVWLYAYHYMESTFDNYQRALLAWSLGMFVLATPYWFNLRRKVRVRIEDMITAWPALAEGTSLAATRWVSFTKTAQGWTGVLTWDKGKLTRRKAAGEIELMESLTDAPDNSITIEGIPGKGNINKVRVTCVENDPHEEAIPFDGIIAKSIRDVMSLGKYMDHQEEKTAWWEDGVGGFHRLFAGATRSGKSGLMHLLVAKYGPAVDVRPWFADLKNGTALLPWSPIADWTATTVEEALIMLQAGAEEVDRRAGLLARRGKEVWEPSETEPVIPIFMDEAASLIGDSAPSAIATAARSAIVEIARKGAGMGVLLVPATQYPTLAALGDSQLKSQLSWRACFRLNQPEQGHFILPSMPKGVDPYRIPKKRRGTCYIDAEGEFRPSMLRVQFIDRPDIDRVVARFGRQTPDDPNGPKFLDGIEQGWRNDDLKEHYLGRKKWSIRDLEELKNGSVAGQPHLSADDLYDEVEGEEEAAEMTLDDDENGTESDNVVAVDFTNWGDTELGKAVEKAHEEDPKTALREAKEREAYLASRRPSTVKMEEAVMKALRENPEEGVAPREVAAMVGKSERTVHRYLERLMKEGKVIRLSYGRYRLTVTPVRH